MLSIFFSHLDQSDHCFLLPKTAAQITMSLNAKNISHHDSFLIDAHLHMAIPILVKIAGGGGGFRSRTPVGQLGPVEQVGPCIFCFRTNTTMKKSLSYFHESFLNLHVSPQS